MTTSQNRSLKLEPVPNSQQAIRLTIANPPINLTNSVLLSELHGYLTYLESSPEKAPKVIVISSDHADIWISHLDLHIVSAQYPLPAAEGESGHFLHLLGDILRLFRTLPILFIAEVNGLAVGGGNEFAVNMDMRFAGPVARFGVPEVAGGIVHGGGLQSLTKLIGPGRALEMMTSSRALAATEAEKYGLVNRAFETAKELRKYVDALAARIAKFPQGGIARTKQGVRECLDGVGSVNTDMQRLGQLAHTGDAQGSISKLIEFGGDQSKGDFELGLPDTADQLWV
ncbi:hypothetical protein PRZ48_011437 [Zasmidium cellare]|uniref:ClpP/crotonase n=1 Tax=Zasmidium cellare TaxID=395010 RepID=A0ABR0E6V7_ZASCE|nr:hypothetical protein PRZ48_011437 [Zasmidium cellare]